MKKVFKQADHTAWVSGEKFPIAIKVAEILNELHDSHVSYLVNSQIKKFQERIKVIEDLPSNKEYYAKFLIFETQKNILRTNYPKNVETHFLNLIIAIYREKILRK